jgi:hypothetical protein
VDEAFLAEAKKKIEDSLNKVTTIEALASILET